MIFKLILVRVLSHEQTGPDARVQQSLTDKLHGKIRYCISIHVEEKEQWVACFREAPYASLSL